MSDVAKAAGVSAMTVSRALKHDGRIAPTTRTRILKIVADLGYVPDRIAGSFSSRRSGFVGVLVPSLNNPHFAETAAGLDEVLTRGGLQLLLGYTNYRAEVAERLIETMLERRPEAMIITFDDHTARARQLLLNAGIPVIEIWETPTKPIGHVVGFSNRSAAAAMVQHLIDSGRRRIGFIGERDDKGTRGAERRRGFIDALKAAGLDPSRRLATVAPPINMMFGRDAMTALLEKWPDTDAVMCVSDPCAYGALTACQLIGRRVPEDVAVAGFGDFEISRCSLPSISTVVVSGLEIGTRAGELTLQLLDGSCSDQMLILVDAYTEPRESSKIAG
ncbi:MAG: LacI family DNA-binding transcriptional regulator [Hyphomicrobiaceae bacterium]|nr:LacI family DNA-binding transcriptional regulator [Hyphomicrobiaceae bacterium]